MEIKQCWACNKHKPIEQMCKGDYYLRIRGARVLCKQCRNEYLAKKRREKNPEYYIEKTHKKCPSCNKELSITVENFRIKKCTEGDNIWYYYGTWCKPCEREKNRIRQNKTRTSEDHKKAYQKNKKYLREYEKKLKERLGDTYVKQIIQGDYRKEGIHIHMGDIPIDLVKMKREAIEIHRQLKQM